MSFITRASSDNNIKQNPKREKTGRWQMMLKEGIGEKVTTKLACGCNERSQGRSEIIEKPKTSGKEARWEER